MLILYFRGNDCVVARTGARDAATVRAMARHHVRYGSGRGHFVADGAAQAAAGEGRGHGVSSRG